MTFGQFWIEHHTPISLTVGILLTLAFFKIPRMKTLIGVILIFVVMFLLTGLSGVLKYLGLLVAIFYGTYGPGLFAIGWYAASSGWDLTSWQTWWHFFLIGALWYPISMLLDVGILFIAVFTIRTLDIASEKFPNRVKRRLETYGTRRY